VTNKTRKEKGRALFAHRPCASTRLSLLGAALGAVLNAVMRRRCQAYLPDAAAGALAGALLREMAGLLTGAAVELPGWSF
jgi:hypothetical protein